MPASDQSRKAPLDLDEYARKNRYKGSEPPHLLSIGWWSFQLLLLFLALSFCAVAVYALVTRPSLSDYAEMACTNPQGAGTDIACADGSPTKAEALAAYSEADRRWSEGNTNLLKDVVVTPFVPLLGTVLGYVFGRQETAQS